MVLQNGRCLERFSRGLVKIFSFFVFGRCNGCLSIDSDYSGWPLPYLLGFPTQRNLSLCFISIISPPPVPFQLLFLLLSVKLNKHPFPMLPWE